VISMVEYHVLNLGAGVQSTCLYLMFMKGMLGVELDAAVFADTQDEPEEVYRHLEWLEGLGGPRIIRTTVGKLSSDLIRGMNSTGQRWVSIPAFTASEGTGDEGRLWRQCSKEYKIIPIQQAIRREVLGLAAGKRVKKGVVVHQYMGISLDESGRAWRIGRQKRAKYPRLHFPLIEMCMARQHCLERLEEWCPHPVPKSACKYCPFHDDVEWARQKREDPAAFAESCAIDGALRSAAVTTNRKRKNTQPMYLHRSLQPLVQIDFSAVVEPKRQSWLGFSRECMGVCGV
jgi:hypothetical protein